MQGFEACSALHVTQSDPAALDDVTLKFHLTKQTCLMAWFQAGTRRGISLIPDLPMTSNRTDVVQRTFMVKRE